jgi:hypothetical protein
VEVGATANNVPLICHILTRLAYTLFRAMQPDAALTQFQRAIELATTIRDQDKVTQGIRIVGFVCFCFDLICNRVIIFALF